MTEEDIERRLIEGLQANDRDCLATLYDAYGGLAYGIAAHLLGRTADAEDVVQESFIALWRQANRLDPSRGVRSYLLTVVHNRAVDRLRRRNRRAEVDIEPYSPLLPDDADPENDAVRASEGRRVRSALEGLPDEQRQTLEMTYFGGLSVNEVASEMRVPSGTVKSRLRLALGRLRRNLEAST